MKPRVVMHAAAFCALSTCAAIAQDGSGAILPATELGPDAFVARALDGQQLRVMYYATDDFVAEVFANDPLDPFYTGVSASRFDIGQCTRLIEGHG